MWLRTASVLSVLFYRVFFFSILPFTISINQGIFHRKVKLLNKWKHNLQENLFYQLKREIQRIRTVHEDEAKNLYPFNQILPPLFTNLIKPLLSLGQTNEPKKPPFKHSDICSFKLGGELDYLQLINGQGEQVWIKVLIGIVNSFQEPASFSPQNPPN